MVSLEDQLIELFKDVKKGKHSNFFSSYLLSHSSKIVSGILDSAKRDNYCDFRRGVYSLLNCYEQKHDCNSNNAYSSIDDSCGNDSCGNNKSEDYENRRNSCECEASRVDGNSEEYEKGRGNANGDRGSKSSGGNECSNTLTPSSQTLSDLTTLSSVSLTPSSSTLPLISSQTPLSSSSASSLTPSSPTLSSTSPSTSQVTPSLSGSSQTIATEEDSFDSLLDKLEERHKEKLRKEDTEPITVLDHQYETMLKRMRYPKRNNLETVTELELEKVQNYLPIQSYNKVVPPLAKMKKFVENPKKALIVLDSSYSMINPNNDFSYAVFGALYIAKAYLMNRSKVAVINFSSTYLSSDYSSDYETIKKAILNYYGGDTFLPIGEIKKMWKDDLYLISDMQIKNFDDFTPTNRKPAYFFFVNQTNVSFDNPPKYAHIYTVNSLNDFVKNLNKIFITN